MANILTKPLDASQFENLQKSIGCIRLRNFSFVQVVHFLLIFIFFSHFILFYFFRFSCFSSFLAPSGRTPSLTAKAEAIAHIIFLFLFPWSKFATNRDVRVLKPFFFCLFPPFFSFSRCCSVPAPLSAVLPPFSVFFSHSSVRLSPSLHHPCISLFSRYFFPFLLLFLTHSCS